MLMYDSSSQAVQPLAKFLSKEPLEIFCKAANNAYYSGGAQHNDCIKAGWDAVAEAGWVRPAIGKKWVRKDSPTSGDVHVDGVIGSKKPKKNDKEVDPADGHHVCKIDDEHPAEFDLDAIPYGDVTKVEDDDEIDFEVSGDVFKVDQSLGLVFGFAIVCKKDGEDYFDTQDDHIPEDSMLRESCDFMMNSRVSKDMHQGGPVGDGVVFAFPLTTEIAKAMGIETKTTGLMIAMKPPAEIFDKYRSGEYKGFSIGGKRVRDEEVA